MSIIKKNLLANTTNYGDGALPDYNRATLMYFHPDRSSAKLRIFKLNVPGYIACTQNKNGEDQDFGLLVASHPGYLYHATDSTVSLRYKSGTVSGSFVSYKSFRAVIAGSANPNGDTYNSHMWLVNPGNSTYIVPALTMGGTFEVGRHPWIFIPCKCTRNFSGNMFECVGVTYNNVISNTTDCGFLYYESVRKAFNGDWTDNINNPNTIYVPTLFVSGTRWNYNSTDDTNWNGSNIGKRFVLIDAAAVGSNRRWCRRDALSDMQIYYDYDRWYLVNGTTAYYSSDACSGFTDPWNVAWYNCYDSNTKTINVYSQLIV